MPFQGTFLLFDKLRVRTQANASAFVFKHKCVWLETQVRLPWNASTFGLERMYTCRGWQAFYKTSIGKVWKNSRLTFFHTCI